MSECCLAPSQQLFPYHGENKLISNELMMRTTIYYANTLSWIFMVLAHSNNSLRIDMPPTRTHYLDFEPTSLVLPLLCCMLSEEAPHINFIVFGLTLSELKPTIYNTWKGWRKDFICQMTMKWNCKQSSDYMKTQGRHM